VIQREIPASRFFDISKQAQTDRIRGVRLRQLKVQRRADQSNIKETI
jgi:hypothetical protein